MSDVAVLWRRIVSLMEDIDPTLVAALAPPAGAAKVRAAERAVGRPFPSDLRAWWSLHDGVDLMVRKRNRWPKWLPVSIARAMQRRAMWLDACAWATDLQDTSMTESRPKPASAVDEASIPAVSATAASIPLQVIVAATSGRTWRVSTDCCIQHEMY